MPVALGKAVTAIDILLVVPHPLERTDLATALRVAGHTVAEAESFQEATQYLAQNCPRILITDVRLGAFNGLHLVLRAARTLVKGFIVIDHHFSCWTESAAKRLGAVYVAKPVRFGDLRSHLSTWLGDTGINDK